MPENKITKPKSIEEIKKTLADSSTNLDSSYIYKQADKEMGDFKSPQEIKPNTNYYKAMTLLEFDKGVLMLNTLPELHRVFALEFSKNLQTEYNCKTPSEKSVAEIISLNFVRVLSIQQKINAYLDMKTISENGIGYLNVMSKELDRAQRHYLVSLHTLKMLKMPPLAVNIRTQTAVVGQNQTVQTNNQNDKAI